MNSSVISWIPHSPRGMPSSTLMEHTGFMNSLDDDISDMFGQDIHNYMFPPGAGANREPTSPLLINIPGTNASWINSFYSNSPPIEPAKLAQGIDNFSAIPNLPTMIMNPHHQPTAASTQLNFIERQEEQVVVPEALRPQGFCGMASYEDNKPRGKSTKKRTRVRAPSQNYDHIIAERRRREQLSQLFVSLSALVPGLKKMDKGSVLEDAIKYMKALQEKVKNLEERTQKHAMESIIVVKKSQIVVDDDQGINWNESNSSSNSNNSSSLEVVEQPLPEVEARVCDNQILIRVTCDKQKGILATLLCKVESLNMVVVNTNANQLGNFALDITIVAEPEKDFNITTKETVTALRAALLQLLL